ncbi:MAG: hypothetical protein O7E52_21910 [Candidatus Poribacteria bacterium]|nr:hypothetical protein [Candidatus Poribacteria bacterium]
MFALKPLSKESIPEALEKAERYRLLNEPRSAESICLDILEINPENHQAIVTLLLAITDQFAEGMSRNVNQARELLPRLPEEYERQYYAGIICERRAKGALNQGIPGSKDIAYKWFRDAMEHFERAEGIRPPENDDAILRWNTCARLIMRNNLEPRPEDSTEPYLE